MDLSSFSFALSVVRKCFLLYVAPVIKYFVFGRNRCGGLCLYSLYIPSISSSIHFGVKRPRRFKKLKDSFFLINTVDELQILLPVHLNIRNLLSDYSLFHSAE